MQDEFEESRELNDISASLQNLAKFIADSQQYAEVERIEKVVNDVDKSFSKSCMGYHAYVYFKDFQTPPAGEHFDALRGLSHNIYSYNTRWVEYAPDEIRRYLLVRSGEPDIQALIRFEKGIRMDYEKYRAEIISILSQEDLRNDEFLGNELESIKSKNILSSGDVLKSVPGGKMLTQDYKALSQGVRVPPHIQLLAEVIPIKYLMNGCSYLAQVSEVCASHLTRRQKKMKRQALGSKIFIGHGGSTVWRDLKDFLADRLGLPWEEFNRTSPAGMATTERLSEMLDNAAFAFVIMTAEDERADGTVQARMNVIHEAGLFQGRLGFRKAIILLENGCEEFSNIEGLGQIRFPPGDIRYKFEEIRAVLEREQII